MSLKYLCLVVCLALFAKEAHGKMEFIAYKRTANFFQGYQQCRLFGGHLASIESVEENAQVVAAITAVGDMSKQWIIGATDLGMEGNFVWVGLNKKAKYLNFTPNEPNNQGGVEHCVAIGAAANNKWNDIPCDYNGEGFVCAYIRQ